MIAAFDLAIAHFAMAKGINPVWHGLGDFRKSSYGAEQDVCEPSPTFCHDHRNTGQPAKA
jgi:hypothetical protein